LKKESSGLKTNKKVPDGRNSGKYSRLIALLAEYLPNYCQRM
jgi:hypothetical protein